MARKIIHFFIFTIIIMSCVEGLRCITMDTVPINVILENLPKPTRVTGFDVHITKPNTPKPKIFTFSPESVKKKVE
jgi:hypothetical protein